MTKNDIGTTTAASRIAQSSGRGLTRGPDVDVIEDKGRDIA